MTGTPQLLPDLTEQELVADAALIIHGFRRTMVDPATRLARWTVHAGIFGVRITRTDQGSATLELGMVANGGLIWRPWRINPTGPLPDLAVEAVAFLKVVQG